MTSSTPVPSATTTSPATSPAPESLRFGHLQIAYDARVLRPRPWTAGQSRWAAELLADAPPGPVLELCAGAGHIGLLAVATASRHLVCVDLDPVACDYARRNAAAAGLADRVEVRDGDLAEVLRPEERFALVIADPPYLRPDELTDYPEDPRLAIDGGHDGLAVVRRCLDAVRDHLLPGGSALVQLRNDDQARWVGAHVAESGAISVAGTRGYGHGVVVLLRAT